jgi:hypothetical protein
MSLKFKDEIDFATFYNLMKEDENVVLWVIMFGLQDEKKSWLGFGFFSFVLKNIWRKKGS